MKSNQITIAASSQISKCSGGATVTLQFSLKKKNRNFTVEGRENGD